MMDVPATHRDIMEWSDMHVNCCRDGPDYQQSDEEANRREKQSFASSLVKLALVGTPNSVMLEDERKQTKERQSSRSGTPRQQDWTSSSSEPARWSLR